MDDPIAFSATDDPRAGPVRSALFRALRPLVRLMIAVGIPFPAAAELLKRLYVDSAANDFPLDGKPITQSRITLLTGVHRKDVRRLHGAEGQGGDKRATVPLGALIIGRWLGDPAYLDADGQPLALQRIAATATDDLTNANSGLSAVQPAASAMGFDTLVASVSTDLRPRAVLDEWLRQGLVGIDADDRVVLDVTAFTPSQAFGDQAAFLGWNLGDHAQAAVRNLLAEDRPLFERAVFYDGLTEQALDRLEAMARTEAQALLVRLNKEARRLVDEGQGAPDATGRMRLGAYFFRELAAHPPPHPQPNPVAPGEEPSS